MPLTVERVQSGQAFKVLLDETLSPKARSTRVTDFARRQIRAADDINKRAFGLVPSKKVTVDGREDEHLANVPPDKGVIRADYQLVREVLAWIMKTLRERSPVLSGFYREGHRLYADDVEVPDPQQAPLAAKYTFFNIVPYARRLEVGKTKSGRAFLVSVPNRIYARTARDATTKFGNAVKIQDGFASTARSSRSRKTGRRRRNRSATSTIPAIFVTIG